MVEVLPPKRFHLSTGSHGKTFTGEACFNELGAILAGKPFSDKTAPYSPIIRRLGMGLNDRLADDPRQVLAPFAYRALGTDTDGREEERRQMCNEWLLHNALPGWLDRAGRAEAAAKLRALPADLAVEGVRRAIRDARDEARSARSQALENLRVRVRDELIKRGRPPSPAVAAAAAADVAVADAAAAAADVVVVAAALGASSSRYWAVRRAVYKVFYEKALEVVKPQADETLSSAIDLMDRMLPARPLIKPVIPHADVICGLRAA